MSLARRSSHGLGVRAGFGLWHVFAYKIFWNPPENVVLSFLSNFCVVFPNLYHCHVLYCLYSFLFPSLTPFTIYICVVYMFVSCVSTDMLRN